VYPSPQLDHGYDVADYFDIEPMYGDLATFDRLIAAARERGIKVLMDVVPNHCSDRHPWFQAALAAGGASCAPGSTSRRPRSERRRAAEQRSVFGGPTWTRITEADGSLASGTCTFSPWQPDFDWSCPDVIACSTDAHLLFDRGVGASASARVGRGKAPGLPTHRRRPRAPPRTTWSHNPYSGVLADGPRALARVALLEQQRHIPAATGGERRTPRPARPVAAVREPSGSRSAST
jgi:alpha-glucosidase